MITIPSGLGGHFTLNYQGSDKGVMVFQVANPGYDHWFYKIPMV
ncbi:hypothetical protein [Neptuniibacter halophilus]|nr:hypothetical protein [Neptuniibacter halophilus]